jgi:hypothetical protein
MSSIETDILEELQAELMAAYLQQKQLHQWIRTLKEKIKTMEEY